MGPLFDPDAPASGTLFGLPHSTDDARVVVLPVPFDATTSGESGTALAPAAVLEASWQVDLSDPETGDPWRGGIAMDAVPDWLVTAAEGAGADAVMARAGDAQARERVNAASSLVAHHVETWTSRVLDRGQIPAILGGDHSVPLGALRAASLRHPGLGVLHIDAHADLRPAYEGFTQSHASIFHNALQLDGLRRLVQVGIRDVSGGERETAAADRRVSWWTDSALAAALHRGHGFEDLAQRIVAQLPALVWVSLDVDGLDPSLCPGTGTPVPGGLTWRETMALLRVLGESGRQIVGFDLCEVGPTPWDANVGARLLYKLSGWAMAAPVEVS